MLKDRLANRHAKAYGDFLDKYYPIFFIEIVANVF